MFNQNPIASSKKSDQQKFCCKKSFFQKKQHLTFVFSNLEAKRNQPNETSQMTNKGSQTVRTFDHLTYIFRESERPA